MRRAKRTRVIGGMIGRIERCSLAPNDVIVITLPSVTVSDDTLKRIREHCQSVFGDDRRVLVMSGGMRMSIVAPRRAA